MSGICLIENENPIDLKDQFRNYFINKEEDTHHALWNKIWDSDLYHFAAAMNNEER